MNLEITSRHFHASEDLKLLVKDRISKINKFNVELTRCHVILDKQNPLEESVEIVAHSKGHEFISHDSSEFFEKSIANAVKKLSIQIIKHHDKSLGR